MTTAKKEGRADGGGLVSMATKLFSRGGLKRTKMQKRKIEIAENVELNFIRAGAGQPMVFLPGWTMTSGFFQHQIEHFSKDYDVIAIDPRSHGESSTTIAGNNYTQHGRDLRNVLEALDLKDVVLVGWSFGVLDIYSYIDQFGENAVKALVLIDQGPASLPSEGYSWTIGDAAGLQGFAEALREDRSGFVREFLTSCFVDTPPKSDLAWMLGESLKTPDSAAIELIYDGWLRDYRETAQRLTVPTLNIVREPWEQAAREYLSSAVPSSELFVLGQHLMFWEFKNDVNARVSRFLTSA